MIPSRHQWPPIDKHNDTPKPGLDQIAYILWVFSHRFNMSYESFMGWEGQRWRIHSASLFGYVASESVSTTEDKQEPERD